LQLITVISKSSEQEKCICSYLPNNTEGKKICNETEIVPCVEVNISDGQVKLNEVIAKLKILGYPLTGSMISVYSNNAEEYVCFGADPLDSNIIIDRDQFKNNFLNLRCVCNIEEKNLGIRSGGGRLSRGNSLDLRKSKRTKERKIGFIIEKVNLWRKYYNGFKNEKADFIKHTLDESAKIVGISKKSLDDYLLQLRLGRKFGFDFNANKNNKVGILRNFVKQHRINKDVTVHDIKKEI